jgi:hypothetical protein
MKGHLSLTEIAAKYECSRSTAWRKMHVYASRPVMEPDKRGVVHLTEFYPIEAVKEAFSAPKGKPGRKTVKA